MSTLEVKGVTKHYKKLCALDNVSFEIPQGRIIGLFGRNGAGKSTLMRCMLGLLRHEGSILLDGEEITYSKNSIFKKIAFIPDVSAMDVRLRVKDAIELVRGINPSWNEERFDTLFARSNLPLKNKVSTLSKGMKTKLYLLLTLCLDVDILLLDEPTLGLDIQFRKEFFNSILGEFYDGKRTIIISTHQVEEVENILQDIIFIDKGKIILYDSIEEINSTYRQITVPQNSKEAILALNPLSVFEGLGNITAIVKGEIDLGDLLYTYTNPRIADLFMAMVGGSNE
ncbi:MAG: ABC transporter ATP-binding protein [Candidatus Cloacimonetes bacterium]|nr:ABC transporter ATP-binding protein [Candidatus Cloacimonadota bacterium]